jgi:gluconolactonase
MSIRSKSALGASILSVVSASAELTLSPFSSGAKAIQIQEAKHAGEEPAWDATKQMLYYVGGDRISEWKSGEASRDFRNPVPGANGLIFDREGNLIVCEAGNRQVTRMKRDGTLQIIANRFEEKKFNSPNDQGKRILIYEDFF